MLWGGYDDKKRFANSGNRVAHECAFRVYTKHRQREEIVNQPQSIYHSVYKAKFDEFLIHVQQYC